MPAISSPTAVVSRRTVLGGLGGFAIGFVVTPEHGIRAVDANAQTASFTANAWAAIAPDGMVTLACPTSEMGQGIFTSLPLIFAEEMDADWSRVRVIQAPVDASFNTSPRAGHWVRLMGKSFWAMHHHCLGIYKLRRAALTGIPAQVRKHYLESAVDEFNYVIENSTPNFIMLPEVFRMRGDVQLKLGRLADANDSYAIARHHKPDYAPAYTNWADELVRTGLKKSALTLLEDGLRVAQDSKEMRASYTKLGGNVEAFVKALPVLPPRALAASAPASGPPLAASAERPASSPP